MDEIVFSSLIVFSGMLTNHCDNLSTHHYHVTYHPCSNTQIRHRQTTQQYFCAVAISFSEKRKRSSCPFVPKRSVKRKKDIVLTRIGLTRKGDPRKSCETFNNN